MQAQKHSWSNMLVVGFMLFALFFGAGNLIFPTMLGQLAGENVFWAILGFIVTGVSLPVLSIIAIAYSGESDVQSLAGRVHPWYGVLFTVTLYLSIGPLFAIPRTGTVSYEIGIRPFLAETESFVPLFIFSLIYFGITLFFSLQAKRIVDIVGKMLTPVLLIFILLLIIAAFANPMGKLQPAAETYAENSFFVGFKEGYLTMDAIAAFVFGIIIISIMKSYGAETKKEIVLTSTKVALVAGVLLGSIYASLAYLGATSVEQFGILPNGGAILASAADYYFGSYGKIILAVIVIFACLTTSIGLVTSCATYFHKLVPALSYTVWAIIFTVVSTVFSNFGLNTLIKISVPVLSTIYPLAICLMILTFLHKFFGARKEVYQWASIVTLIISVIREFHIDVFGLNTLLENFLPLYKVGLGWLLPAIVAGIFGFFISKTKKENETSAD